MQNKTIIQFIKFAIVGGVNTGVDWLVYFLVTMIPWFEISKTHEAVAKGISFMVAVSNSYVWNRIWTFKSQSKNIAAEFIKFFLVSLIGLAINTSAFYGSRQYLNSAEIISLMLASSSAIFWNFFASRKWAFTLAEGKGNPKS